MASGRRSQYYLCDDHNCIDVKCPKKSMQKVKWSREEDARLKRLVDELGTDDWNGIANHFKKRSDSQCQHRWQKVLNPELVKGPWTKEEDERVIKLVQKYGPKRWSIIAKHLNGRIGKQCRERWHNHLNPEVKKSCWTQEEDKIIYAAHKRIGNRWAEIAKLLPGRTDNSIKNHWNSTMRRKVEQEGYLQDIPMRVHKTKAPITQRTKLSCSSMGFLERQNHYFMTIPSKHTEGYSSSVSSSLTDDSLTNSTLTSLGNYSMEAQGGLSVHPPESPTKFLAFEESSVFSSLQTIPELAETLELIDSDPLAWSEVTSFSLTEVPLPVKQEVIAVSQLGISTGASCCFNDSSISNYVELMPDSSLITTKMSTPPYILKRWDKKERFPNSHSGCFLDNSGSSPKVTPVKALAFSPSEFFTVSGDNLTLDNPALTSTPVCARKRSNTTPIQALTTWHLKENSGLKTPKVHKAIMLPMSQTPTPFKTDKASKAKMHCQFKMMMQQPASLAYLEEVGLREEGKVDVLINEEMPSDFCSWRQEADASTMRIRKFLDVEPWKKVCKNAQFYPQEHFNNVQIHGESLLNCSHLSSTMLGCEKLVYPPSPVVGSEREEPCRYLPKHTLTIAFGDDCDPTVIKILHHLNACAENSQSEVSCECDAVLFGKTDDQITVAEQARKFLSSQVPASRFPVL
ncbi:hypothetical protein DPEC_G00062560 [Dallia pectoralis]|uniref:Uncharacterized protein n=1 Tax=Dallia pectoralis TaxID=75939 RepID=A0ACC2H7X0_DALPE|nr:hypothetical protein DPEC_G00062560 [Dallia pectoralis]